MCYNPAGASLCILTRGVLIIHADRMTHAAQQILESFETLPEPDKQEVAAAILRSALDRDLPSLQDEELTLAADQVFLELDRRESLV